MPEVSQKKSAFQATRTERTILQPISACNDRTKELGNTTDDEKIYAPTDLKIRSVDMA
jgi:hypothetical protein